MNSLHGCSLLSDCSILLHATIINVYNTCKYLLPVERLRQCQNDVDVPVVSAGVGWYFMEVLVENIYNQHCLCFKDYHGWPRTVLLTEVVC